MNRISLIFLMLSGSLTLPIMDSSAQTIPDRPKISHPQEPSLETSEMSFEHFSPIQGLTTKLKKTSAFPGVDYILDRTETVDSINRTPKAKSDYTYDENGFPTTESKYEWSEDTKKWYLIASNSYKWNADGKLLEMWNDDDNAGVIYKYDSDDRVAQEENYLKEGDEWIIYKRTTYEYDNHNNVVDMKLYGLDYYGDPDVLVLGEHHIGEYDDYDRLTKETVYKLVLGTNDFDITVDLYEYTPDSQVKAHTYQIERKDTDDELYNYMRRQYEYGDYGLAVEELVYWNEERSDWSGGSTAKYNDPEFNVRKLYEYDNEGRQIMARTTKQTELDGEYIVSREESNNYELTSDNKTIQTYQLDAVSKGERTTQNKVIYVYNSRDWLESWEKYSPTGTGDLYLAQENLYSLNEDGKQTEVVNYNYYRNGTLGLSYRYIYEYDADCYEVTLMEIMKTDPTNPVKGEWTHESKTEASYIDGAITSYYKSLWTPDEEEWILNEGHEFEYDFNVIGSRIMAFTTKYDFMPVSQKDYDPYNEWTVTNFSFVETTSSGITQLENHSPIITPKSIIFNLSGTQVATGSAEGLLPGIYIVRNGNNSSKICISQ